MSVSRSIQEVREELSIFVNRTNGAREDYEAAVFTSDLLDETFQAIQASYHTLAKPIKEHEDKYFAVIGSGCYVTSSGEPQIDEKYSQDKKKFSEFCEKLWISELAYKKSCDARREARARLDKVLSTRSALEAELAILESR
jgi:hypothetical protein